MAAPERVASAHAPEHAPARLGYIPALDGLRALAVVAVLLYHADQKWIPGGFLGVDVFFVISGYLITCLLLSDYQQTHGIGLKRFWYRRARRLLPALFAMLFVVSLYAIFFLPDVLDQLRGEVISALLYVENWFLIFRDLSYFQSAGRPPLLQHVWSLAVEEQFYLFWPLILMLVLTVWGKSRKALLIGVLAGVAVSTLLMITLYHPYSDPSRVYYGTDTRVAALLLGAALAFVWAPWRLIGRTGRNAGIVLDVVAAGSVLMLFYFFLNFGEFDPGLYNKGGFLLVAAVSALLIAATVHPATKYVPKALALNVFLWIGVRSYGIYLWHWPIYMVTRPHSDIPLTGIPLLVLRLTLTFVVAALSYKYIEEPIRHGAVERQWAHYRTSTGETRRKLMTYFTLGAAGIAVGLVIIVVGLGNGGSAAAPAAFGNKTEVVVQPGDTLPVTTTVPGETTTTPTAPPAGTPTTAPGTQPTTVTAIGDSVMLGAYVPLKSTIDTMFNAPVTGVDAAESRQFSAGVDLIQSYKDKGQLGQDVVVQLGTNGTVDPGEFDRMMGILSDRNKVVIINAKVPRSWEDQVNSTLAAGVPKYKNAVLLDWHSYGGAHPEFFYDDGIHLRPEGAAAYANFVARALSGEGSP